MILTGLVADLSPYPLRYLWYALGCAALLVILAVVWGPLRRIAESSSPGLGRVYRRVAGLLAVLWIGYPLFWIIGPSGLRLIGSRPRPRCSSCGRSCPRSAGASSTS
jgi:bacteriorhodopsin